MGKRIIKVPSVGLLPYKILSIERCKFIHLSRYMGSHYDCSFRTIYHKLRENRVKKWEWMGIENCIRDYMPEYRGPLADFWNFVPARWKFIGYMTERGMSAMTVYHHFTDFDFKDWELKGISGIVEDWKKDEAA